MTKEAFREWCRAMISEERMAAHAEGIAEVAPHDPELARLWQENRDRIVAHIKRRLEVK